MPVSTPDGQPVSALRIGKAKLALWTGWLMLVALFVFCW